MSDKRKELIMTALQAFVRQRPRLEFGNYGDVKTYRSEMRSITRDLHHARALMRAVELRDSITADKIISASKSAFSGRLSITEDGGKIHIDYCTGQYFPTEYRSAVCSLMSSLLFYYTRDCMPKPTIHHSSETGETVERYDGLRGGDWIRSKLKREFGRWIDRWL